jgi:hypothetical protein
MVKNDVLRYGKHGRIGGRGMVQEDRTEVRRGAGRFGDVVV